MDRTPRRPGAPWLSLLEEVDQFFTLACGQPPEGLPLGDPALVEQPGGLDLPVLRGRHNDVEHLGGEHEVFGLGNDLLYRERTGLQFLLQLRTQRPDLICPAQGIEALVERALRRLGRL